MLRTLAAAAGGVGVAGGVGAVGAVGGGGRSARWQPLRWWSLFVGVYCGCGWGVRVCERESFAS